VTKLPSLFANAIKNGCQFPKKRLPHPRQQYEILSIHLVADFGTNNAHLPVYLPNFEKLCKVAKKLTFYP